MYIHLFHYFTKYEYIIMLNLIKPHRGWDLLISEGIHSLLLHAQKKRIRLFTFFSLFFLYNTLKATAVEAGKTEEYKSEGFSREKHINHCTQTSNSGGGNNDKETHDHQCVRNNKCQLYLAESSIPNSGRFFPPNIIYGMDACQ